LASSSTPLGITTAAGATAATRACATAALRVLLA
jgi:hypothetical protein